ncbi:hypothetical protein G9P44_001123 [Scheffersomyces stipitis]|nr:hypothetical protein G9P44_001123 [Scheffersomyces stipitis]
MSTVYGYTTPANVKTLLVPINKCTSTQFNRHLQVLPPDMHEVRLLDLSPNTDLQYFNPQTFPNGRIFLDLHLAAPEANSIFLHDFEPFRKTFVVIGVASYTADINVEYHLENLAKHYPGAIVHNIIVFDTPTSEINGLNRASDHSAKSVFYHDASSDHNLTALETIICGITQNFLVALDTYAASYTNITLRSPVSITDSYILTKTINQAQKRLSSGSTSFKVSFSGPNPPSSNPIDSKSKSQQRHNGRQLKLMANFYLLAGKYVDSVQHFIDAAITLKKCDDYLWLGSALEGISNSVVLLHYIGSNHQLSSSLISSILSVSKMKLSSLSTTDLLSPKRTSVDQSSNGRTIAPSPRSSVSGSSFSFSSGADINAIPLPELIKIFSARVLFYYDQSTNDFENMVPDLVYVESILRTIKFMIGIYLGGNDSSSLLLQSIVFCKSYSNTIVNSQFFSKSDILKEIDKVFQLQLVDMGIIEQCRIYSTLASMYGDLDLVRKKAFILRFLIVGILPKLNASDGQIGEEIEIQNGIANLTGKNDQNQSIRGIFEYLFTIYGINLETESSPIDASIQSQGNWVSLQIQLLRLCLRTTETLKDYPFHLKLCTLLLTRYTHCLPSDDQHKLKGKIERILFLSNRNNLKLSVPYWDPFLVRKVKFINNRNRDEVMPFLDYQNNTINTEYVATARSRSNTASPQASEEVNAPFFDPYNKPLASSTFNKDKILIRDDVYQLKVQLQNPFAFEVEINDLTIVTEGNVTVQTLKNQIRPFNGTQYQQPTASRSIIGSLNKARAVTTGSRKVTGANSTGMQPSLVSSNTVNSAIVVPPCSSEHFVVGFKPLQVGELKIIGFNICIGVCEEQFFRIVDKELTKVALKVKDMDGRSAKKENTLDKVCQNLRNNSIDGRISTKNLVLHVIPPQPALSLIGISMTNGWIMLLEGERFNFSIRLANNSSVLINYLSFSFWDSTIEPLNKKLNASSGSQTLPASDIYEIEWYLLQFKPFRILNKETIMEKYRTIDPQSEIKIDYEINGRRGMKESKIILEYAHKESEDLSKNYIKYVNIPLNVSIMPSLEIVGCDILPLFSSSLEGFEGGSSDLILENLDNVLSFITKVIKADTEEISDYCLFLVDIRNSWNEKLSCSLSYSFDETSSFDVNEVIEPGKTTRFLLPFKRVSSKDVDLTKPIPSLRNKQFVKNYTITEAEEMQMREIFWLRNSLLEKLSNHWKTIETKATGKRAGSIDLRAIRLSTKMSNVLVYSKIRLLTTILDDGQQQPVAKEGTQYLLKIDEFYTLRTTIINNTESTINGILRHLPFPMSILSNTVVHSANLIKAQMSIDRKILINGVLQSPVCKKGIEPGDKIDLDLGFVILEKGEYEWGTVLDTLNKDNLQIVGREPLYISAS